MPKGAVYIRPSGARPRSPSGTARRKAVTRTTVALAPGGHSHEESVSDVRDGCADADRHRVRGAGAAEPTGGSGPNPAMPWPSKRLPWAISGGTNSSRKLSVETGKEHLQLIALIHKATGLEPADISRVTIVFLVPPGQDKPRERPALVILLAKPCDINKVVLVLGPRSKKALRGGRTYHVSEDGALYPVSDRLFIIGQRRAVELMMDRARMRKRKDLGVLRSAWQQQASITLFGAMT